MIVGFERYRPSIGVLLINTDHVVKVEVLNGPDVRYEAQGLLRVDGCRLWFSMHHYEDVKGDILSVRQRLEAQPEYALGKLSELLTDMDVYLDDRADADDGHANREMHLLTLLRTTHALLKDKGMVR